MNDTSETITQRQFETYRRLDGSARLRLAFEMTALARNLALARLRDEHPDWPPHKLHRELLRHALLPNSLPPLSDGLP